MTQKKLALRYKLLISLISLILSLTALELGLAAVGRIYYTPDEVYRDDELETERGGVAPKTLVAVGDSFTHGGLVEGNATYTHYLRQFLQEQNYSQYRVKNLGICELNTGELLKRVPDMLNKHQPYAMLLLVGATNRFNPWDYEAYANKGIVSSAKKNFFNLRVVKMARFIALTLFAQEDPDRKNLLTLISPSDRSRETRHDKHMAYIEYWREIVEQDSNDDLARVWTAYFDGKKKEALRMAQNMFSNRSLRGRDLLFTLTYLYLQNDQPDKVVETIEVTTKNDKDSEAILDFLTYHRFELAKWYRTNLQYDKAIDWYLQAIALDPDADYFYYEVNKIFDRQSHYTSQMMHAKLTELADQNADIILSKMYQNHLKLYKDKQRWESGIEDWIRHDLNKIAEICQRRGVRLIIQKYPVSYPMANSVLMEIAKQYQLPVVDHLSRFDQLEPKKDYFYDDDHCTPKGHRIMAENVLETLVQSQTISNEQTN